VLLLVAARPAQAQYAVLYTFGLFPSDGIYPLSGLAFDGAENLYGTTTEGGLYTDGTVYELQAGSWGENILYNFTGGSDGSCFWGLSGAGCSNVILDSQGNLYGTAPAGGAYGLGVVFELSPTGTETVLHSFGGPGDGHNPAGGVIMDSQGNLYGTTQSDYYQEDTLGIVYELSPSGETWTESIIYSLPNYDYLNGGLAMDTAGNIYGTSYNTVFKLSPNGQGGWNPTVIHTFTGAPKDGSVASGAPVLDQAGNLYGKTTSGGSKDDGTVYKLTPQENGKWKEKILYNFTIEQWATSVVLDATDNIYGTEVYGGSFGDGLVFELVAPVGAGAYKERTLLSFNGKDGAAPFASLIFDGAGKLYGTTEVGGYGGYGVVYELNPSAQSTTTTLTSSPNPSSYGEEVTFSAVVAPAPADGESISFMESTNVLGTGTLSGGVATLSYSALPVGTSKITAAYGGDLTFDGSTSNVVKQKVKK